MQLSAYGRQLLIQREGKRNYAYPDPASPLAKRARSKYWGYRPAKEILATFPEDVQQLSGKPWTCGIGITKGVTADTHWDDKEGYSQFKAYLVADEAALNLDLGGAQTSQNEYDALASLRFNIGGPNFRKSTVLRQHKAGNKGAAARASNLFNMAQGAVDKGLVARRAAEAAQYLTPYDTPAEDLPPTPDPQRSMAASEINIAAVTTTAAATASAAGSLMDAISGKEIVFLCLIIVAAATFIIYQRLKQRKEGYA